MKTNIDDYRPAQDDAGLALFAAARRTDPATSSEAAESMPAGTIAEHEAAILRALAQGPAGKTAIAARIGSLSDQQVIRRMAAMERRGLVVRTGGRGTSATGHGEAEYRIKE